jgi:hypothetical protein
VRTIDATATSSGSSAAVWALLADASKWPEWGSWSKADVEGGGPQGPGKVRALVRRPFRLRELVTDWEPESRMGYELLSGMHVRGYHATVTLEAADGGGTRIHWQAAYESADPLTAFLLRMAIPDACRRVAKAAAA